MRRNTITLIKYVAAAVMFITFGPLTIKYFLSNKSSQKSVINRGLPVPPEDRLMNARPKFDHVLEKKLYGDMDLDLKHHDEKVVQFVQHEDDPNELIDWHDYKFIEQEKLRTGPGEQGQAHMLSADDDKRKNDLYKVNGFNALASDQISLQRALRDIRHPACQSKKYRKKLLTASVIVPFHNEHWSTLLRTAYSAIIRSPPELLMEVILVDDFSTKEFLKDKLDAYLLEHLPKVRVVRAKKREGLIRTRLLGAKEAVGDVLIFMDSHCETNTNWLPPLLDPIAKDHKTVVCPFIDVIDFENFQLRPQDEGARGAFDWEFFYKRLPLLANDRLHPADPFKSPVMAGGLFAMHQEWFWSLGGYDPGLDIWGGEQYELSFKIWQCGGIMVDAPCSRIGHIYRKFAPFPNPGIGDFVGKNYKRVAEVWMDEYAEYLYVRRPHYRNIDPGDITEQRAIRTKHNCKSFKWFIENVAFDLKDYYPPVEPKPLAEGEFRNKGSNWCLDTRFKNTEDAFELQPCIKDGGGAGGEQQFELSWHRDIRPKRRTVCFDVSQSIRKAPVILYNCHGMKGNQHWKYNLATNQLYHPISNQCLDSDKERHDIFMEPCNMGADTQKWIIETVNKTAVKYEWSH